MTTPARPRLLLVDDTPANIDILVGLLKHDYELKIATSGERALKLCEGPEPIDLVLLDVMMPEMDGYEVCRRLRARPQTHELPILFLTAKAELADLVQGFAIGGNDYLTKPFRAEELLARVRTHLLVRSQQREIEQKNVELGQLLHILFHDMANHFAVLNVAVGAAEEEPPEAIKDELLPMMKTAVKNGIGLLGTVRELESAEAKPLALAPVDLGEAVAEAMLLMRGRIEAKHLVVRVDVPAGLTVMAEPNLLINSVINNLLTNAIKFTHDRGEVTLAAARDGAWVRLVVRDRGIGMPEAVQAVLFDLRKSASRRGTAGERGSGFGMPLMYRWVQRFGGRVEVTSREAATSPDDHGTTFTVWLVAA